MDNATTTTPRRVVTCSVDRNGKIRRPDGRFGTLVDVKRVNGDRIKHQLSRWNGARIR